jgi:Tfp pilus assembly protein PilO
MNVKILFFPLSVTIAFAVFVFYVKPEVDTVMRTRDTLAQKETLATDISKKVENIHALEADLNANKDNEEVVMNYLPDTRDDDRIVDRINFLVLQSGLVLTSVKIDKVSDVQDIAVSDPQADILADSSAILAPVGTDTSMISQTPVEIVKPKTLSVTVDALGSYESIRDVVGKIAHVDRFQEFTSVSIERVSDTAKSSTTDSTEQPAPSTVLNTLFTIHFTYLPKVNTKGNFNRPILAQNRFDFNTVQKLKQSISSAIPPMEVGSTGTNDPFLR